MKKLFAVLFALMSVFAVSANAADTTTTPTCCAVPTTLPPSPPPPPPPLPLPATNLLGCWSNDLLNVNTVDSVTGAMGGFARMTLLFCVNSGSMNADGAHNYQGSVSWFVDGATVSINYVPAALSGRRPFMRVWIYLPLTRFGKSAEYFNLEYQMYLSPTEDNAWGTLSGSRVEPENSINPSTNFDIPTEIFSGTVRAWNQNSGGRG